MKVCENRMGGECRTERGIKKEDKKKMKDNKQE